MNQKNPLDHEKITTMSAHEGEKMGNNGLFIPHRQMTIAVSVLIAGSFSLFMGGYFFGKRTAVKELTTQIETDSFADQVYSSMCALYDKEQKGMADAEGDQADSGDTCVAQQEHGTEDLESGADEVPAVADAADTQTSTPPVAPKIETVQVEPSQKSIKKYYAELVGFGKKNLADACVQKMKRKGFDVLVKKRVSTTAKGKTVAWYQVVTPVLEGRDAVEDLVDRISRQEKIKGARIINC